MIAVGDSTDLEIIFATRQSKNRVAKSPMIKTNEGPPDKRVQISATVVDRPDSTYPFIISPYKLDLSQFGEKVRTEIEFKIHNVSDQKLSLSLVSVHPAFFKVELPASIDAGKTASGKLMLVDRGTTDAFEKSFTIETGNQEKSRFTIPVKRSIHPDPGTETAAGSVSGSGGH